MLTGLNQSLRDISACCFRAGLKLFQNSNASVIMTTASAPPRVTMARAKSDFRAPLDTTQSKGNSHSGLLSRRVGSAPNLGRLGQVESASDPSPSVVSLAPVGDAMRFESGADPVAWDFSTQVCDKRWDPQAAFWMMWFSLRAFTADQPQTQAELVDVGCEDLRCITVPGTGLQALVARCPDGGVVLSFRGTTDLYGWCTDLNFRLSPFSQSMPESISDNISEGDLQKPYQIMVKCGFLTEARES